MTLVVTSITGAELRRESTLSDASGTLEFVRGGLPAGPCFFRILDDDAQGGRVLCAGSAILAP